MAEVELRKHSQYFFFASFIAVFILAIVLVKPFITALLGSFVLAYVFYPVYKRILHIVKYKQIAAFLMSLFVVLALSVPLIFAANAMLNEANQMFFGLKQIDFSTIDEQYLAHYFGENVDIASYTKDVLNKLSIGILKDIENFILALPEKILALFVMLFVMYYLFKDGAELVEGIKNELPLRERYKKQIARRFSEVIYATIYGVLVTAIIQGIIGIIGMYIFGVSSPLLWGILMTIAAMIPVGGTALVWLPLSLYQFFTGYIFDGVGLFLYGLLIISTIDNIIKPNLIGGRGKIHPALVLLGVLGGLKIFGLIGVIIGPLALAILVVFYDLYKSEQNETQS